MENLTKKEYDFVTRKTFTGRYVETLEQGHVFEDKKGIHHFVPCTPHTDLGVSQIIKGTVVQIDKTKHGYDVWKLDENEIIQWEKPEAPAQIENPNP